MFGIKVTVPELIAMQKTYDEATEQGWQVEDVYEWAALSEEEKKTFKELREKACGEGLLVSKYMEGLKTRSSQLSKENERLSIEVDGLKLKEKSLNDRCSWLNTWLEEDYERKKKGLEEKYLQDIDGCQGEFLEFKGKTQARKEELQNDCKEWETKRDNLITKCGDIEKQSVNIVRKAEDSLDNVKGENAEAVKERDMARGELRQLRALAGPKGAVSDLAKRNEDLKAQLAERDQQLAWKAMQLAGKWLNQEEALQTFNEESRRLSAEVEGVCRLVSDEVKHRMENAGPALHVLEFLENELPDDKFKELTFAINLAEVKRESLNPDNPYFAHLSSRKKELLGVFPTTEECQRLHEEKMENLHKRREAILQKIREAANEIATTETWEKTGERLLTALKSIVEAYFNPKQD
ncbi:MAG TPA: hypothetical protein VMW36_07670 [Patescibacteria group bacterium]|nr:hypothetical protein [Patescibacteria group bacterium]